MTTPRVFLSYAREDGEQFAAAPRELHARLADAWSTPHQLPGTYAWRYAVHHMIEALPVPDAAESYPLTRRLVVFVTHPAFREGHFRQLAEPPALERDLERALR